MPASMCYLPNGQTFTVTPVFGGFTFKSNDMNLHHSAFPPGWTVILRTNVKQTESSQATVVDYDTTSSGSVAHDISHSDPSETQHPLRAVSTHSPNESSPPQVTRFTKPTLNDDSLYISYIVNPPSSDFKPASSPSRQIAMMLWITLLWYFHEPEPDPHLYTAAAAKTPVSGKPKGEWRVNIRREGIFHGRNLLQKLERMGLIASEDSSVGIGPELTATAGDRLSAAAGGGGGGGADQRSDINTTMFASRRSFWQLDARIFLFTLSPTGMNPLSPYNGSPFSSRTASPIHNAASSSSNKPTTDSGGGSGAVLLPGEHGSFGVTPGPFWSGSHLPTFYPPPPTQYTFTNGVRHPIRPKAFHQGETFYIRYIPSMQQYLSFRVPYLPPPTTATASSHASSISASSIPEHHRHPSSGSTTTTSLPQPSGQLSDLDLLHKWMNEPRVNAAWGMAGPISTQEQFLRSNLSTRHSFPVLGCWDGKPFGYFEIYWVKEDRLGSLLGGTNGNVDDYDRGIHVLVGEQEFRGPHRVAIWLSALVHFCWLADNRTKTVVLEPRVDNLKLIKYLQQNGFYKEGEVTFPHKQSAVMKIKREYWEAPAF